MKKTLLIIITLFLWGVFSLYGQSSHYIKGELYIKNPGVIYISTGDTVHIEGNITTARHAIELYRGLLSFAGSSGWVSSNGTFVNGFVRSHKPDFFVFPVGQGVYRPAAVSSAADAAPTDIAYYNTAQYSTSSLGSGLVGINNESWIVQGSTPAIITLSWTTDISLLAANFDELCMAGWDAALKKWVEIPSEVDVTSPVFGVASNLGTQGSVSTTSAIVPNSYAAYTLGKKCSQQITISNIVTIDEPTCTDGGSIQFEISGGSGDYEYSINGAPFAPYTDGIITGLSAGYLTINATDVAYSCANAQADFTVPNTSQDFGISVTTTDANDCAAATGKIQITIGGTGSSFTFTLNGSAPKPLPATGIIENLPVGNYVVKVSNETGCSDSRLATISCPGGGSGSSGASSKNIYVAGKVFIDTKGFVYIPTESKVHIEGNMTTVSNAMIAQRGTLSFSGSSGWTSSNESFVNGYVRSHKPGAFVFPVGQDGYRPAAISNSANGAPTDAAYYNTAQYNISALGDKVLDVSDESWIIQGATPAVLTLSWSSDISLFAAKLEQLCVVGWDPLLNKWVEIPSEVDLISRIFGGVSDLETQGTVSTADATIPNTYAAYTLGIRLICPEYVEDEGGIEYKVVPLSGKCWTENLRTPAIDDIPYNGIYTCSSCPAQLDTIFGLLYTWNAAVNICPDGWRVPTQAEWSRLKAYPASQLKSITYWLAPPGGGTDDYDFNALPAGKYNSAIERFEDLYGFAGWWASDTIPTAETANYSYLAYFCNTLQQGERKRSDGLSVRCVMD